MEVSMDCSGGCCERLLQWVRVGKPHCEHIESDPPLIADIATQLDRSERLILAEVCATRKEVEALLGAISDLNDRDIHRARSDADLLRRALVEERILELQQRKGALAAGIFDDAAATAQMLDETEIERLLAPQL